MRKPNLQSAICTFQLTIPRLVLAALTVAVTISASLAPSAAQDAPPGLKPEEWRLLPVRIHLLRAEKAPALNAQLTDKDARRVLGKVNGIWKQAGLQFYPESILVEEANAQALYTAVAGNRGVDRLPLVRPHASRTELMFHLYYIRQMGPNGICFDGSHQLLFIKDTAELQPVPGGIDEPLPRVSAHEMGHALGLPHRQDTFNLMASGTTGTQLNDAEIATARGVAEKMSFRLTPRQALDTATKLGDTLAARDLLETVTNLPGDAAEAAQKQLATQIQKTK